MSVTMRDGGMHSISWMICTAVLLSFQIVLGQDVGAPPKTPQMFYALKGASVRLPCDLGQGVTQKRWDYTPTHLKDRIDFFTDSKNFVTFMGIIRLEKRDEGLFTCISPYGSSTVKLVVIEPAAPMDVRLENVRATEVTVTWRPPSLSTEWIDTYLIYIHHLNGSTSKLTVSDIEPGPTQSFVVGDLTPEVEYSIEVSAVYPLGSDGLSTAVHGPLSKNVKVKLPTRSDSPEPPTRRPVGNAALLQPQQLQADQIDETSILVRWRLFLDPTPPNLLGFQIFYTPRIAMRNPPRREARVRSPVSEDNDGSNWRVVLPDLIRGVAYRIFVRPILQSGRAPAARAIVFQLQRTTTTTTTTTTSETTTAERLTTSPVVPETTPTMPTTTSASPATTASPAVATDLPEPPVIDISLEPELSLSAEYLKDNELAVSYKLLGSGILSSIKFLYSYDDGLNWYPYKEIGSPKNEDIFKLRTAAGFTTTVFFYASAQVDGMTKESLTHVSPPLDEKPVDPVEPEQPYEPRRQLKFTSYLPDMHPVVPGGNITQTCSAMGSPKPQVRWFKDGDLVSEAGQGKLSAVFEEKGVSGNFTVLCVVSNTYQLISREIQVFPQEPEVVSVDVYTVPVSETDVEVKWTVTEGDLSTISRFTAVLVDDSNRILRKEDTDNKDRRLLLDNLTPDTNYKFVLRTIGQNSIIDEDLVDITPTMPDSKPENETKLLLDVVEIREDRARLEIKIVGPKAERVGLYRIRVNHITPHGPHHKLNIVRIPADNPSLDIDGLKPHRPYELVVHAIPKKYKRPMVSQKIRFRTSTPGRSGAPVLSSATSDQMEPSEEPSAACPESPPSPSPSPSEVTSAATTVQLTSAPTTASASEDTTGVADEVTSATTVQMTSDPTADSSTSTNTTDGPQTPLKFTSHFPDMYPVVPGGNITQTCSATGSPQPEVKWYKDGKLMAQAEQGESSAVFEDTGVTGNYTILCVVSNDFELISTQVQVFPQEPEVISVDLYKVPVSETEVVVKWAVTEGDLDTILGFMTKLSTSGTKMKVGSLDKNNRSLLLEDLSPGTDYTFDLLTLTTSAGQVVESLDLTPEAPVAIPQNDTRLLLDVLEIREDRARLEIQIVGPKAKRLGMYRVRVNHITPHGPHHNVQVATVTSDKPALDIEGLKPHRPYEVVVHAIPKGFRRPMLTERVQFRTSTPGRSNPPVLSSPTPDDMGSSMEEAKPTCPEVPPPPPCDPVVRMAMDDENTTTAQNTTGVDNTTAQNTTDVVNTTAATEVENTTAIFNATGVDITTAIMNTTEVENTTAIVNATEVETTTAVNTTAISNTTEEDNTTAVSNTTEIVNATDIQQTTEGGNETGVDMTTMPVTTASPLASTTAAAQEDLAFSEGIPEELTVEAGESVALNCSVSGSPEPEVAWYRDNNLVTQAQPGESAAAFEATNITENFTARCAAQNAFQLITADVNVVVKEVQPALALSLELMERATHRLRFKFTVTQGNPEDIKKFKAKLSNSRGHTLFDSALDPMKIRSLNIPTLIPNTSYKLVLEGLDADGEVLVQAEQEGKTLQKDLAMPMLDPELYLEAHEITAKKAMLFFMVRNMDKSQKYSFRVKAGTGSPDPPFTTDMKVNKNSDSLLLRLKEHLQVVVEVDVEGPEKELLLRSTLTFTTPSSGVIAPKVVGNQQPVGPESSTPLAPTDMTVTSFTELSSESMQTTEAVSDQTTAAGAVSDETTAAGAVSDETTAAGAVSDETTAAGAVSDETTAGTSDETTAAGAVSDETTAAGAVSDETTAGTSDETTAAGAFSDETTAAGAVSDETTAATSDETTAAVSDATTAATSDETTAATSDETTAAVSDATTAATSDETTAATSDETTAAVSDATSDETTAATSDETTAAVSDETTADILNEITTAAPGVAKPVLKATIRKTGQQALKLSWDVENASPQTVRGVKVGLYMSSEEWWSGQFPLTTKSRDVVGMPTWRRLTITFELIAPNGSGTQKLTQHLVLSQMSGTIQVPTTVP